MVKEENAILPAQELRSLPPEQALSAKLLAENSASLGRKTFFSNIWVP